MPQTKLTPRRAFLAQVAALAAAAPLSRLPSALGAERASNPFLTSLA